MLQNAYRLFQYSPPFFRPYAVCTGLFKAFLKPLNNKKYSPPVEWHTIHIFILSTIYNPLISTEISFLNNYEQWWSLGNLLSIDRSSWPLHTRTFRAPDSFLNQLVSPTLGGRIGKNIRAWAEIWQFFSVFMS